ncbi:Transcriptional regulator of the glucitol operon [Thermobacillus xylanilyticus]|uniref:Transcriptional regulator of the glucitol operon n=1 Tax=Thermobacillus xylanilyticus TaxID=76633 RepID=A0ABN7S1X4_THEXY|nr:ATP-binding protein [Thermobacillus xylanilyticus]CAG5088899.1 Transcriptional regulator of the glucitol operon [Thermobacillus xylanilyticus]
MAEIENQVRFAEALRAGVASLKSRPGYKTVRRNRNSHAAQPESYLDRIAAQIGVSSSTLKSWIGQMGRKYVPGRVEDGKLFGLLWIVLRDGDRPTDWLVDVLGSTSIPVFTPPAEGWVRACLRKAKVLLASGAFGPPEEAEIDRVIARLFPDARDERPVAAGGPARSAAEAAREGAGAGTVQPQPAVGAAPERSAGIRHNLPTRWSNRFIGRRTILDILNRWMHTASPLCLITGWSGVGKSTIALEAAYACLGETRGEAAITESPWPRVSCAIWISADLKGLSYSYFLDTIAYQLGRAELLGQSENEKQFVVRNALAHYATEGTILLIVDNVGASDRDILFFLANLPQGTKAIMTSRDHRHNLFHDVSRDVLAIQVGGMEREDALRYLRQETQVHLAASSGEPGRGNLRQLLESDDDMLAQLVEAANGNPKALSLCIAYIADGVIPVRSFIREVQSAGYSLASLFDYLFGHTWERCPDSVKKLWMALPLFQTPPGERSWAAAAGLNRRAFHQAADQMRAYALITAERSDDELRYRAHQTVVVYGEQKLREHDEFRTEAQARWLADYLDYVENHLARQPAGHIYWSSLPGSGYARVRKEWPNLYKLLQWCEETGNDDYLTAFMLRMAHFLSRISLPLRIRFGLKAAEAAGRLNRGLQEALFRIDTVGWACFEIGRSEEGFAQVKRGLAIAESAAGPASDPAERAERDDLRSLGLQFEARYHADRGELERARTLLEEAMAIPASPVIRHRALLLKGNLAMLLRDDEQAVADLEEANRISLTYGGEKSIEPHYLLGAAYVRRGEYEKAREAFEAFLYDPALANQIERIYHEYGMAQLLAAQHRHREALDFARSALNRIDAWEPGIRIRPEVAALHERLLETLGERRTD